MYIQDIEAKVKQINAQESVTLGVLGVLGVGVLGGRD